MKTDKKSRYHVHNGPRACPGQRPHTVGFGSQPTPLSANNIRNSRINSGYHYTALELLWPQVAPNSVVTSAIMKMYLLKSISSPLPSVSCIFIRDIQDYFQLSFRISIYGENCNRGYVRFKRWPLRIQEVAPITKMCDVALCFVWHLVAHIIRAS